MNVTHYDLFAGIGGFSYALDAIFNEDEINHIFCEWEAFPTAVLKQHWPEATYYGDIADLVADTASQQQPGAGEQQRPGYSAPKAPREAATAASRHAGTHTILTGGFPCQPFSHAGRRQGTADDRYLWPAMLAVIRNVRPDWIIAENVRGLATWNEGMVLETVCADLESEGYEVQPLVIPACAIGAPHRRDRIWIVAHRHGRGDGAGRGAVQETDGEIPERHHHAQSRHADKHALADRHHAGGRTPARTILREDGAQAVTKRHVPQHRLGGHHWQRDWREVAFATCHDGVDDGLSRWMDGVAISAARHRRERLKACGNAIVPQVAMAIFRAIKQS